MSDSFAELPKKEEEEEVTPEPEVRKTVYLEVEDLNAFKANS